MAMEETAAMSVVGPSESQKVNNVIVHVNGSEDTLAPARSSLLCESQKVNDVIIHVNGSEDTLAPARSSLLCEKVKGFIIHVNGSEDTVASARFSLWEKVRNFVTLLNGLKNTVSSTWTGLASSFAALIQRWRDKIIFCMVQRWIVAFCLAAVYMYRAICIGGLGCITVMCGLWLTMLLGNYLTSPDLPDFIDEPLPVISLDEFKPFIRGFPEYEFWSYWMMITIVALVSSFFFRLPEGDVQWYLQVLFIGAFCYVFVRKPLWFMRHYNQFPFNLGKQRCTGKKSASRCGSLAETEMALHQISTHWLRQRWPLHQISTNWLEAKLRTCGEKTLA